VCRQLESEQGRGSSCGSSRGGSRGRSCTRGRIRGRRRDGLLNGLLNCHGTRRRGRGGLLLITTINAPDKEDSEEESDSGVVSSPLSTSILSAAAVDEFTVVGHDVFFVGRNPVLAEAAIY
jgi:hypothetical protein